MKRIKEKIGLAMALVGLFLAIATANGSNYEILLRLAGVVIFAIGGYLSKAFYFQQDNEQ